MSKNEKIANLKTYIEQGIQLKEEGKFALAIEKLSKALTLNPNFIPALNQLAGIYEGKKDFEQAIIYYQHVVQLDPINGAAHARLARAMMAQKNIQGAITLYQKAIALQPEQRAWVYVGLGDAFNQNGQLDKVIAAYQKAIDIVPDNNRVQAKLAKAMMAKKNTQEAIASNQKETNAQLEVEEAIVACQKDIELQPNNPDFYLRLARLYLKNGRNQLDRVIENYQKAIKLKPNLPFHVYQQLSLALEKQGRNEEAVNWIKSIPKVQEGKIYLDIWKTLNQADPESQQKKSPDYPREIKRQDVEQYFTKTSEYKIITLASLSEQDKQFMESAGLSLSNLKSNETGLITRDGLLHEESTSCSPKLRQKEQQELPKQVARAFQSTRFQLSMVEEGCIYAICPHHRQSP